MKYKNLVKRWRSYLQMTQSEFGAFVGRTSRTVAGWEKEESPDKIPTRWLARVLSVSEDRFLKGPETLSGPPGERGEGLEKERGVDATPLPARTMIVPEIMLPYYCLSDLRESFERSKVDAFTMPDRVLSDHARFVMVRLDLETSVGRFGNKLLVRLQDPPKADDLALVWDEKAKRADVLPYSKRQHYQVVLGVVF